MAGMVERAWRTLIMAPHVSYAGAVKANIGWLRRFAETCAKERASEMRVSVGDDGCGVYYNEVEVR
jgi:hypothetical protein